MSAEAAEEIGEVVAGIQRQIEIRCRIRDAGFKFPCDPEWERKLRDAAAVLEDFQRQAAAGD